ncbi:MAG: Na/Pi cotransporter family protein [bacterium]|nr:Na/Pi cotransporter family protein [bacterium]
MEIKAVVFMLLGGLGLLMYGIKLMGDGVRRVAGTKMRNILKMLTKNAFIGLLVGTGIVVITQSSSAMMVMTVGFVNAGLMTLRQSIGVMLGANIGTTFTAQLIAFKLEDYALPAIGIGMMLNLFSRRKYYKDIGMVLLGFGMLFLGIVTMSKSVYFLRESQTVRDIFVNFGQKPILGVLAGTIVTMIIQSSSATIALTMAIAAEGLVDFKGAVALVLGDNIGTCITSQIAAIGTSISARRTAWSHTINNIISAIVVLPVITPFTEFIESISVNASISRMVANSHTIYNIITSLMFLPVINWFVKLLTWIVPGEDMTEDGAPKYLDERLISTPSIVVENVRRELGRMLKITTRMVCNCMDSLIENKIEHLKDIKANEDVVDDLQDSVSRYLIKFSETSLLPEYSKMIPSLLHCNNDIERIGDHCENLATLAERKIDNKHDFSEEAERELKKLYQEIKDMIRDADVALIDGSQNAAKHVFRRETVINQMVETYSDTHINRLSKGECKLQSGIIYIDVMKNLEKIGDHLVNIAQAVIGELRWDEELEDR